MTSDASSGAHLVIVCGLPGSGKTTRARQVEGDRSAVRFCPDEWIEAIGADLWDQQLRAKIERLQFEQARRLLSLGVDVVIEWGTWARSEREQLRAMAADVGATAEVVFLDAPLEELWRRVSNRGREDPPITRADFEEWSEIFQRPTPDELA